MEAVEVFQDWLNQYLNFEHNPKKGIFWLDTINYLCERFGNPQDSFSSFHIAGSKGKGSVSKMISCILDKAGFKTGLYTSPHITDFRERISTPTGFFSEEIYEGAIKELVPRIESILPCQLPGGRAVTWFELVTLYGFLCFRRANVDFGVFEVGMGGRLDATNAITPKISCINVIELEHTEFLGDTIEKVAAEKAGIIKPSVPVLIAHQESESVNEVFRKTAIEKNAPIFFMDDLITDLQFEYLKDSSTSHGMTSLDLMKIKITSKKFSRPIETTLPMIGEMQARNAAMAAMAVKIAMPEIDERVIEKGLSNAMLPGRFEIIHNVRNYPNVKTMILDGAHTVNSIKSTIETCMKLNEQNGEHKKMNLLFACAADKDVKEIAPLFKEKFYHIFLTKPGLIKESDIDAECEAFENAGIDFIWEPDFEKFIPRVMKQTAKDGAVLLVTGSFYLIAEVKKSLGIWS